MPRRARARAAASLAVALLALLAATPAASGHAALVGSTPAPGQRVQAAPGRIVLRFTEPLNPRLTEARLARSDGTRIDADTAIDGSRLTLVPARPLGRGAYRVTWRTVSTEDGHALEGSFSFGVRAPAVGAAAVTEQSPLARGGWLRALARAAMYVALLLFAGAVLLAALRPGWLAPASLAQASDPGGELDRAAAEARARGVTSDLGVAAAALAAVAALVEAATAASSIAPDALSAFFLTSLTGGARLAVIGFVLLAGWLARRAPAAAAMAAVCALGAVVASGHANSAPDRALAIVVDWVHLGAVAIWLGGAAMILLVWGGALRRGTPAVRHRIAGEVLPGFGRVAIPAFLVVVATGVGSAIIQLGSLDALWTTAYGIVLSIKILLVAAIALVAFTHAAKLRPALLAAGPEAAPDLERRHWRLVQSEPLLAVAVIVAVALLAVFPLPPSQAQRAAGARAGVAACDPCPLPPVAPDELAVADNAGPLVVAAWIRRTRAGLRGSVRMIDYRGRPAPVKATVLGATEQRACGPGCLRFERPPADRLRVAVRAGGRTDTAVLPADWVPGADARARRILGTAQRTMRAARGLRETEIVSSGPGQVARTDYRLAAPDRIAYETDRGVGTVIIGDRQWLRLPGAPWRESEAPGGVPFTTRGWFRWTAFARALRLLRTGRVDGRAVADLALADTATPAWIRLRVDLATGHVTTERLVAAARFVDVRFFDVGIPQDIRPPTGRGDGR